MPAGGLVRSLERFRDAAAEARRVFEHFNCRCQLEPPEGAPPEFVEGHTFGHPVLEPASRRTCTCGRGPWCACGFCVACRGHDFGLPAPIDLRAHEAILRTVNSAYLAGAERAASSYTVETAAMEAIREAMAVPAELPDPDAAARARALLRASYRPMEGPTSPCSACDRAVDPAELWVGKKSGIALCDGCMVTWEQAGRARRSGEF